MLLIQHSFLQKVFFAISFTMSSSNLWAQRYRPEYDDVAPTPWWLKSLILIVILIYLWVKQKVKISGKLYLPLSITLVVIYSMILLYEWFFYCLLAIAALCFIVYVKWGDNIDKFTNKLKKK